MNASAKGSERLGISHNDASGSLRRFAPGIETLGKVLSGEMIEKGSQRSMERFEFDQSVKSSVDRSAKSGKDCEKMGSGPMPEEDVVD